MIDAPAFDRDPPPSQPRYRPAERRYDAMHYRPCGRSGLRLSAISLGLWHNFGKEADDDAAMQMVRTAIDLGITHFDLANNYGPPPGSAEKRFGRILRSLPKRMRDEMVIATKAGYLMWPGPYGEGGSRKYLLASLDQSLQRMKLDYVDIFYHHRPDPNTPLEETLGALDQAVRSGKALYAGISNYPGAETDHALRTADRHALCKPILHQVAYSIFNRHIETDLLATTAKHGLGVIVFSPLAQGLLTDRYLRGIPSDSRAARPDGFLRPEQVTPRRVEQARQLDEIAQRRGQTLAQMALAWALRAEGVCSALIGASSAQQVRENVACLENLEFTLDEYAAIDAAIRG